MFDHGAGPALQTPYCKPIATNVHEPHRPRWKSFIARGASVSGYGNPTPQVHRLDPAIHSYAFPCPSAAALTCGARPVSYTPFPTLMFNFTE